MAHELDDVFREWAEPPSTTEDGRCANAESVVRNAIRGYADFANRTEHTALIYFATHGYTGGPHGLYLAVRDTCNDRLSTSWFALSELIALIDEHRPARTITVVDACESGRHVGGTASLSRDNSARPDAQVAVESGPPFGAAKAQRWRLLAHLMGRHNTEGTLVHG
jgi:hypothetical protein